MPAILACRQVRDAVGGDRRSPLAGGTGGRRQGWGRGRRRIVAGTSVQRETFYEAQRRHRRSAWRFSALSTVAVLLLGLPLSVVVSPVGAALASIGLDVVNLVVPMPDPLGDVLDLDEWMSSDDSGTGGDPAATVPTAPTAPTAPTDGTGTTTTTTTGDGTTGDGTGDGGDDDGGVDLTATQIAVAAGAVLVPGMVLMGLAWLCVRRLFMRSAAGAVVLAAGARPPRPGDAEERQLVNLVEEMALAAGVPPPRVMVLDADVVNAAVVGRSIHDVTLLVPRGLLDELGRDATGALVADLLASVVNGDLRAALVVASVFQTFDLVGAVIAAPFSRRTRRVLWRLARMALRRRSRRGDGREEHYIAEELADAGALGGEDEGGGSGCLTFPFLAASLAYSLTHALVGLLFVQPIMAALWRRRRLLADATAVELTRNPDALARAFEHLEEHATTVAAGPWAHLWVVGSEIPRSRARRHFEQRMAEARADGQRPGESHWALARRKMHESREAQATYQQALDASADQPGTATGSMSVDRLAGFLPGLDVRLRRLEAMGARLAGRPEAPAWRRSGRPTSVAGWVGRPVLWLVGWVVGLVLLALILACGLMLLALLGSLIYLALAFQALLLGPLVVGVNLVLR
jgi:Zn-dependent protease with chaperone function